MTDIQKCTGMCHCDTILHICRIRETCLRYTIQADPFFQTYGPPGKEFQPEFGCELFIRERRVNSKLRDIHIPVEVPPCYPKGV
jgi:hypothetical protein